MVAINLLYKNTHSGNNSKRTDALKRKMHIPETISGGPLKRRLIVLLLSFSVLDLPNYHATVLPPCQLVLGQSG
jgi:hypothetical protein